MFLVMFSSYGLAFWYGATLINSGEITAGGIVNVFFAVIMGAMGLGQAAPSFTALAAARGAAYEIFKTVDRVPDIDTLSETGEKPQEIKGDISFKGIFFNYPKRPEVPILQGLTISVAAGETLALVGPSGCGTVFQNRKIVLLLFFSFSSNFNKQASRPLSASSSDSTTRPRARSSSTGTTSRTSTSAGSVSRSVSSARSPSSLAARSPKTSSSARTAARPPRRSRPPPRWPTPTISSPSCPRPTTRWSASAVSPFRVARSSALPYVQICCCFILRSLHRLLVPSSATPRSSCWTRPPRPSTPSRRRLCRTPSTRPPRVARPL